MTQGPEFSLANRLQRSGHHLAAALLYEHLAPADPGFAAYQMNAAAARAKLGLAGPAHYPGATAQQRCLRLAHVLGPLGERAAAQACLAPLAQQPDATLAMANLALLDAAASLPERQQAWLGFINRYLKLYDVAPLQLAAADPANPAALLPRVRLPQLPKVDGPLVTVCMACHNAEHTVVQAVQSVLAQSHHNLELCVVNDASTDGTWAVLLQLQRQDGRIKPINQLRNMGTYVARNQVLQQAQGRYFTVLDADDIALPHRLALQVQHLEQSGHVGVLTDWVRVEQGGRVALRSTMGGVHQHEAGATLMVDRARALALVGYWDAVRFAADTEFIFRLRKKCGDAAVDRLRVPTVLALQHPGSLTSDPLTGIDTIHVGHSPVRARYKRAWKQWHQTTPPEDLYLHHPLLNRPFEAPTEMGV